MKNKIDIKFCIEIGLAVIFFIAAPFLTKEEVVNLFGYWLFVIVVFGLTSWVIYLLIKIKKTDYEKLIASMRIELQPYAKKRLKEFKYFMNGFKNQRTGKLPKLDYYAILNENVKKTQQGDKIWACSSILENEWDPDDDDERILMHNFNAADYRRVESTRIFILKKEELKPRADDYASFTPLKNLLPYLKATEYPNTRSFAIGKMDYEKLTEIQKNILGQGFCAFDCLFSNTFFIYDTPANEINADKLGFGEILFDENIIKEIKELFDLIIKGKTLNEFVFDKNGAGRYVNANNAAIEFLKKENVFDTYHIK